MKIKELNISEFGSVKDKRIVLDEGMNVIFGENESGKSTVLLFIKFMLYGLGRRSSSNTERERSVSWSGHTAAGSMSFLHSGREYRIERRFAASTRGGSESLEVISLSDGAKIDLGAREAGEYFLGVPKEVFESTACVGQLRSTDINGEKTASSIQNLLSSADENVDTAALIARLDKIRVSYRHKNQTGGSLQQQEKELADLRMKLERAREDSFIYEAQEQKLEAAQREYAVVKSDFEKKDRILSEMNKINILNRFSAYREKEKEFLDLKKKAEELKRSEMGDFSPSHAHIAELSACAEAVKKAEELVSIRKRELEKRERELSYDADLAQLGKKLEENGGADKAVALIDEKKKKIKKNKLIAFVLWAVAAVASAGGGVAAFFGIWAALASLITVPVAVIFTVMLCIQNKKNKEQIETEAEKYSVSAVDLPKKANEAVVQLALMHRQEDAAEDARERLCEAEEAFRQLRLRVSELLAKSGRDGEPTAQNAEKEAKRLEGFLEVFEKIKEDLLQRNAVLTAERSVLSEYDESELSADAPEYANEVTPAAISTAERERSFLLTKKTAYEQRIAALRESIIGHRANAQNPLEIGDRVRELEAKYEKDSEFYSALTLAIEALERAGEVMGGSVIPEIANRAGELLSKISDKKYTAVRTTSGLELSLEQDGFKVKADCLSAGTKDSAYLALRISLFMQIFASELPPLVLDESLCQLDTKRATRLLTLLSELCCDGVQCVLFTSHEREGEILNALGADFKGILLN